MIEVTENWWVALLIAGLAGLVGGLIYELLLSRLGDQGMIELLKEVESTDGKRRYFDLGVGASMLVGAVAAVGFLYFLQPTDTLDETARVIRREYDPFRLVPGSMIVGSAGGVFLSAMQERAKRLVSEATNRSALAALLESEDPDQESANEGNVQRSGGSSATDAAIAILSRSS